MNKFCIGHKQVLLPPQLCKIMMDLVFIQVYGFNDHFAREINLCRTLRNLSDGATCLDTSTEQLYLFKK